MARIELLTVDNRERIKNFLTAYIKEVLQEEEYLNTFEKCRLEAERVECFKGEHLTEKHVENWLRGLPLGTAYITYNICKMLLRVLAISEDDFFDRNIYKEKSYDLDCFYWKTLAKIIMKEED